MKKKQYYFIIGFLFLFMLPCLLSYSSPKKMVLEQHHYFDPEGDSDEETTNNEYQGPGYLELYRGDLLNGYIDTGYRRTRKETIYNEILNLSIGSKGPNSVSGSFLGNCSSTPIKIQKGKDYVVTSPYGNRPDKPLDYIDSFHTGVDLKAPLGTPLYSISNGTVVEVLNQPRYCGNGVKIGYDVNQDGIYENYTLYCHMSKVIVVPGDQVKCGQKVGESGETGAAVGAHLHFEYLDKNETAIDPMLILQELLNKNSIYDTINTDIPPNELTSYALQFIGRPYVWGGTSLTNGVDCSGFTQAIFNHFGISLPRTTKEQVKVGTLIASIDQAKPGDLLFQSDDGTDSGVYHVLIYLGNGKAIHASNSKPYPEGGVKISETSTRNIYKIKRILPD